MSLKIFIIELFTTSGTDCPSTKWMSQNFSSLTQEHLNFEFNCTVEQTTARSQIITIQGEDL